MRKARQNKKQDKSTVKSERSVAETQRWARLAWIHWAGNRGVVDVPPFVRPSMQPTPDQLKERKVPDDRCFAEIARLAKLDIDGAAQLRKGLCWELDTEWSYYWQVGLLKHGSDRQSVRSRKRSLVQLKRLVRHSSVLHRIFRELDGVAVNALMSALRKMELAQSGGRPKPPSPNKKTADFDTYGRAIVFLNELFSTSLSIAKTSHQRPRGRPIHRRRVGFGCFQQFVLRLLWDVRTAGGRLSLEKNSGKGTLPDVLTTLRPYFPTGFVPKNLPFSTLAAIKVLDTKIADLAARSDNFAS
jgi:hypothetical protein